MVATGSASPITNGLPIGAEVVSNGTRFRVWAPKRKRVRVLLEDTGEKLELNAEPCGYFEGFSSRARAGSLYRYLLDDGAHPYPDPASRYQPQGPQGPSQIVDPGAFPWKDASWRGVGARGQVIYEMHIGTFTPEGTWESARARLPELHEAGITLLEVMPIADFAGRWGWGYDGVNLFAPTRIYGSPDDARRFIDDAHRVGIGVLLDVVYNHFGPEGNYIGQFADDYFTSEFKNDWGQAINFEAAPVREFYEVNAAYWISEFHFDGLRFDATQDIHDRSPDHILAAIVRAARDAAGGRSVYLVAENEPQQPRLVRNPEQGGYGLDALWNDDFHHSAMVALTGRKEAYYMDYNGAPQEFVSAAKYGYLYQGQWYSWQEKERGTEALDLEFWRFVSYLQNHDQVANSARGDRPNAIAEAGRYRAMTALLLLSPATPMLFQGQEFGATTPFLYFCDHGAELCEEISKGRQEFLAQFPSVATPAAQAHLPRPDDPSTFERSKLDWDERVRNDHMFRLHKDLMRLRAGDTVIANARRGSFDGAVLGPNAFLLRYFGNDVSNAHNGGPAPNGVRGRLCASVPDEDNRGPSAPPCASPNGDRLLIVNLGIDLAVDKLPEPLIAPPAGQRWKLRWSSEDPEYGGSGTVGPDERDQWVVAGNSAVFLIPITDLQAKHE